MFIHGRLYQETHAYATNHIHTHTHTPLTKHTYHINTHILYNEHHTHTHHITYISPQACCVKYTYHTSTTQIHTSTSHTHMYMQTHTSHTHTTHKHTISYTSPPHTPLLFHNSLTCFLPIMFDLLPTFCYLERGNIMCVCDHVLRM